MSRIHRAVLCIAILSTGLVAHAALERMNQTERPRLRRPLASIPLVLGGWVGYDQPVDPELVERAQTTEYLSRTYESRKQPSLKLQLWVNYSEFGTNLRHTPEICLPSVGWTKVESQTRVLSIPSASAEQVPITRLGYARGELVEHVGFWYYIFGEGALENYVRRLPITSRSSHGRTTRGSSMTVEVFCPGDQDPDGGGLSDFAQELIQALEPILPVPRATYYIP
jgi:EpsI family protein